MNRLLTIIIVLITFSVIQAQSGFEDRCPYKGIQVTDSRIIKNADDFTITTTDGITRNLYNTLDSGKTVFIDLFYTTCSWCQYYSPIIEEIYLNTGAGQEDIEFWGISNNLFDTNWIIDQYKENYNVSNPCAGPWGGGTTALSIIVNGQTFLGFPTYCVICPDRTLYFDPCYPPTVTGFDPYFELCAATIGIDDSNPVSESPGIISTYPNPANSKLYLDLHVNDPLPVKASLINLLGTKMLSSSFEARVGSQTINFSTQNLAAGIYFLYITQNGQVIGIEKVQIAH